MGFLGPRQCKYYSLLMACDGFSCGANNDNLRSRSPQSAFNGVDLSVCIVNGLDWLI